MRIAMMGTGYVGLVTGACLADGGHEVVCVDMSAERIAALRKGEIPIYEPGLPELVARNAGSGRLSFTQDGRAAVAGARIVFIAVGTPSRRGDGQADLSHVYAAAREIAASVTGYTVVVTKSTVPVGEGDAVERIIRQANPAADISVVSNPEFMREGAAIADFKQPDRIVVGTDDARAREVMAELYRPLFRDRAPMMFTARRAAELIKYAANAYLAMKVTFINEMADLCEAVGVDVEDVARGIGSDARIGSQFLHAGPGYGGSCLPKDTAALIRTARDNGRPLELVEAAAAANEKRKRAMGKRIVAAAEGSVRGKRIAVLGLTFKPDTDDVRESPAFAIIGTLLANGALVSAYDPQGMENARAEIGGVALAASAYEAATGAEVTAIVTEWDEFRGLDLARLKQVMARPVLVDFRNIYDPQEITRAGFRYVPVGRPWPPVPALIRRAAPSSS
jgi:UDPglucose 6-dehydrogenase